VPLVALCSLYVPKIIKFYRCIKLLQAKNEGGPPCKVQTKWPAAWHTQWSTCITLWVTPSPGVCPSVCPTVCLERDNFWMVAITSSRISLHHSSDGWGWHDTWCVRVADMAPERNALMQHVYPQLKEFCRKEYRLEFQVYSRNATLSRV